MNIDDRALTFSHKVVLRGAHIWDTGCFSVPAACHGCNLVKKHAIGCFLLLSSIFFYTILLFSQHFSSNKRVADISEKTIRGRALKFLQNVDLDRTHVWKKFSDLDLDSLWMTLTPCFQLWALVTLWKINRFEIFF